MEIDRPEIYELRLRIETSIKRKIQTPADFDFLRGIIWERTHEQISTSTLKRLWGYVDGIDNARNSTLNVLSKALGYENWDALLSGCLFDLLSELYILELYYIWGFPGGTSGKEPACPCRRHKKCDFDPWVKKIPWRRAWQPIPVFFPGESHRQKNLVGYSP